MKSGPILKSEVEGLSDLHCDHYAVEATRQILGLEENPVTLVRWTQQDNPDVNGLLALRCSESAARDFMQDLANMDDDIREEYHLPAGHPVALAYYTPVTIARRMDPGTAVDPEAVERADNDASPGVAGRP